MTRQLGRALLVTVLISTAAVTVTLPVAAALLDDPSEVCVRRPAVVPAHRVPPEVEAWARGEPVVGRGAIWTTRDVMSRAALRGDDGLYSLNKFAWFLRPPVGDTPTITGHRVDGAGTFHAEVNNAYSDGTWWAVSSLYLSTEGCWEITGRHRGSELTFRVWIAARADAPETWCEPAVVLDLTEMRAAAGAVGPGPAVTVVVTGRTIEGVVRRSRFSGNAFDIASWTPGLRPERVKSARLVVPAVVSDAPPVATARVLIGNGDLRDAEQGCTQLCLRLEAEDLVQCRVATPASPRAGTGVRIDPPVPDGWTEVAGSLYVDIGGLPSTRADATVATFDVPPEPSLHCDVPVAALERLGPADAFISVVDAYPGVAYFNARPDPASLLPPEVPVSTQLDQGDADLTPSLCLSREPDFRFKASGFTENNRMVQIYVALGLDASPTTEEQVLALLQRIVVEPRG